MTTEDLVLYCDGLCEPNPGLACFGWWAADRYGRRLDYGYNDIPGPATNNIAEYTAVIAALRWAYKAGHTAMTVRSDSQVLVRQITGEYGCHTPALQALLAAVQKARDLMTVAVEWIPREQNEAADALSRQAYYEATGHEAPTHAERVRGAHARLTGVRS
jgi:ribonuclease HI